MKFSDIPQLTKAGSYQVNMPLRYLIDWLDENAKHGLDLEPDFQRAHVWTDAQRSAYIEFLLRGGRSGRVLYFNCPDWMHGDTEDGYSDFVCVDGLQRITAIRKFLANELPAFGTLFRDFEGKLPLDVDVLVNVNTLKTKREVLVWYLEMNAGGTPHSGAELEKVRSLLEKVGKE